MNFKRVVWLCKCTGLYANFLSDCFSNIPTLPRYEGARKPVKTNKASYTKEQVQRV